MFDGDVVRSLAEVLALEAALEHRRGNAVVETGTEHDVQAVAGSASASEGGQRSRPIRRSRPSDDAWRRNESYMRYECRVGGAEPTVADGGRIYLEPERIGEPDRLLQQRPPACEPGMDVERRQAPINVAESLLEQSAHRVDHTIGDIDLE